MALGLIWLHFKSTSIRICWSIFSTQSTSVHVLIRVKLNKDLGANWSDQLVGFLVVEHVHPGLSPRLGMDAHIFLNLMALCFQY
jgi:hypothetical protein